MDKLFDGTVTKGGTTEQTLTHPYTDYKALCVVRVSGSNSIPGAVMIVDTIQTGASNNNNTGNSDIGALRFNAEDATKFHIPQGTGTINFSIYGFK